MVGVGMLALLSAGLTPSSAADETSIYIVQGLPSRTISVAVDGDSVVSGLAGGKVAGPFPVQHGTRTVTVSEDGKTLVTSKVKLPGGSNSEIVVHLPSPTGDPMITRFDNNRKPVRRARPPRRSGTWLRPVRSTSGLTRKWSWPISRMGSICTSHPNRSLQS